MDDYYTGLKEAVIQDNYEMGVVQIDQFISIADPPVKQWSKDEWMTYTTDVEFKHMDQQKILQQIKLSFHSKLRRIIWPWIASSVEPPYEQYVQLKSFACPQDGIINRDIDRTHTGVEYFKGKRQTSKKLPQDSSKSLIDDKFLTDHFTFNQKRLFYILRAYANYDSTIGYVQGMNYLVGTILYCLDDHSNSLDVEVTAFQILLYINYKLNWRQTYSKSMKKLKSMIQHLQQLLQTQLPIVYEQISSLGLPFLIYFDQYFFTVMNYKTSIEFSAKIIDIFLIEGENVIFDVLMRVFALNQQEILSMEDKDMLLHYLKEIVPYSAGKFGIQALIPQGEIIL